MRKVLATFACVLCTLFLVSCDCVDTGSQRNKINETGIWDMTGGSDLKDNASFYSLELVDDSTDDMQRIRATFLVPVDIDEEDIISHANNYIEENKTKFPDLQAIIINYTDDVVFNKYWDESVAYVTWLPRGSYDNHYGIPVGDYSTHTTSYIFSTYDEKYELDHAELELYVSFQEYAFERTGKYIIPLYNAEVVYYVDDIYLFEDYAEVSGVAVDYLIEVRMKASMRRMTWTYSQYTD